MKQEVKVSFYVKRNEQKEDGTCPVMVRLTVRGSEAVFSAKLIVPADLWASGRAKGKSKTATEINRKLDELRASALSHWRELSAVRENVAAEQVKNLLLGMAFGQETLLAYFRAHTTSATPSAPSAPATSAAPLAACARSNSMVKSLSTFM